MKPTLIVRCWTRAFAAAVAVAAVAYVLLPGTGAPHPWWVFVLAPGAGLYVLLNGSLLFGGGLGPIGDPLVLIGGSAAVWSGLWVLVALGVNRWRARRRTGRR